MSIDPFTVVAEPHRRRILDRLRGGSSNVGELAEVLDLSQPTVSKHLKVLRDAGFVRYRVAAQQRIYTIDPQPLTELAAWLEPYRSLWSEHFDALARHLDTTQEKPS